MPAPLSQRELMAALAESDPATKCEAVAALWEREAAGFDLTDFVAPQDVAEPGRPPRPVLVAPVQLPRRGLGGEAGRAALVHAIAHIEFNAINLALDAASRFAGMPEAFYRDWLSVAADEARHFRMLHSRLAALGIAYGDFPAHDGLWEMARRTADSCVRSNLCVTMIVESG